MDIIAGLVAWGIWKNWKAVAATVVAVNVAAVLTAVAHRSQIQAQVDALAEQKANTYLNQLRLHPEYVR